jgi:hypothetical protein
VSSGVVKIRDFDKLCISPSSPWSRYAACNPPRSTVPFAQVTAMYAPDASGAASKITSPPVLGNGAPQGEGKAE